MALPRHLQKWFVKIRKEVQDTQPCVVLDPFPRLWDNRHGSQAARA